VESIHQGSWLGIQTGKVLVVSYLLEGGLEVAMSEVFWGPVSPGGVVPLSGLIGTLGFLLCGCPKDHIAPPNGERLLEG
jgi:hypothetical protein